MTRTKHPEHIATPIDAAETNDLGNGLLKLLSRGDVRLDVEGDLFVLTTAGKKYSGPSLTAAVRAALV